MINFSKVITHEAIKVNLLNYNFGELNHTVNKISLQTL